MNKKGFTLIELLAAIVILAILAGITVTSITRYIQNSRENTARITAQNITNAVLREHQIYAEKTTFDLLGADANLLENPLVDAKSPWGAKYQSIIATIDTNGNVKVCMADTNGKGLNAFYDDIKEGNITSYENIVCE